MAYRINMFRQIMELGRDIGHFGTFVEFQRRAKGVARRMGIEAHG
jgi:hypothetical protein